MVKELALLAPRTVQSCHRLGVGQTLWCFWDVQVSVRTLQMGVVSPGAGGALGRLVWQLLLILGLKTASVGNRVPCMAPLRGCVGSSGGSAHAPSGELLESNRSSSLPSPQATLQSSKEKSSREDHALTLQVQLMGTNFYLPNPFCGAPMVLLPGMLAWGTACRA